jgi:hypothetical protein
MSASGWKWSCPNDLYFPEAEVRKLAAAHSSPYNHFNHERHLYSRQISKQNRSVALTVWRQLGTA